jgi:cytoskeletal protein RodZ
MNTTVGQQLRQAREERSLTLEQAAKATHIRAHYLTALESGEFGKLPSAAQARGFLRAYGGYLKLDVEKLLAEVEGAQERPTIPLRDRDKSPAIPAPGETEEADEIFAEIGRKLRRQRELLGLSLDDIERHTHLRQHYLVALEAGDMEGLPSPVQGRGMLNNYASFLGLDPEPLMLNFAEGLQARLAARQAARPEMRPSRTQRKPILPAPLRRIFSGDVLIGGSLVVFLVVFVVWGAIRIFAMTSGQVPTPTAPSIADVLLAPPTATMTATPIPPTPTIPPPPIAFPTAALVTDAQTGNPLPNTTQEGVQVYVTVRQRAWMRVIVDGEVEFEGRVIPGSAYPFAGANAVEVLTGNGAALQIIYNGQDLGSLGNFGQVAERIFTLQGIVTATPTITATPTASPILPTLPPATATAGENRPTVPPLP